jgi:CHAT domain-containing protein/Tfp pilus assembly protein PilF
MLLACAAAAVTMMTAGHTGAVMWPELRSLPWLVPIAAPGSAALALAKESRALAAQDQLDAALAKAQEAFALARAEFGDDHAYIGFILDDLATLSYRLGRLDDALVYSEQALPVIAAARGLQSADYAILVNNQATILTALGRFAEAAPLYEQAHQVFLAELGAAHERTARAARNLGIAYSEMAELERARRYFDEVVAANRELHGAQSLELARAMLDRAGVDLRLEAVEEARATAERAQSIMQGHDPEPLSDLAQAEVMLARADIQQSRLGQAHSRLESALARLEGAGLAQHEAAASVLYNLGFLQVLRGQSVEAEQTFKRVLELYRRQVGEAHPAVARTLHSLAIIYGNLGQPLEAERLYRRAIAIFTDSFGPDDVSVAASRLEMGLLLADVGRAEEAIAEAEAALAVYERLGGEFAIKRAYATSSLGFALHAAGRLEEAAGAFERALATMAEVRGPESSDLPPGYTQLGEIYTKLGRYDEADARLKRAIAIREKDQALTPHGLVESLSVLASLRVAQNHPADALDVARRAVRIMRERLSLADRSLSAAAPGEQRAQRHLFEQFLAIASAVGGASPNPALLGEMFEVAQFPQLTGTAAAISRMAARFATGEDNLATLVRERQDALEEWRARDALLTERLANGATERDQEAALRADLELLSGRIAELDQQLQRRFPEFAELTQPRPVTLSTTQTLLSPGEALVLHVTDAGGSHLFFIRPDEVHYAQTRLDDGALTTAVAKLRRGLDLLGVGSLADLPAFDSGAAHDLYRGLLEPFAADLSGVEHLIFVPDRAMQNLPPALLLMTPADPVGPSGDFKQLDFLVGHYAISVLPSISALRALRQFARRSGASDPFIGFGDPDFEGKADGPRGVSVDLIYRNATEIDSRALRRLTRLPDTRAELRALAEAFGASQDVLYLGARASEAQVKNTDLARFRVITFATHGLIAGDFAGLAEPALALTPPEAPSPTEDGLLTATEVAGLKLDADLVILSACNTAAPAGKPGAEGLSGLARAFFYAGSRTLLVSHWYVDSRATAWLTSGSVAALQRDPSLGSAEALRQSMLRLLDGDRGALYAHPVFWAPFVAVGEGAAR